MKIVLKLSLILVLGFTALVSRGQITGNASFYSDKLHGRKMSNGERYNRDSMTCAHLHFPLGTLLSVFNPANGKEVVVKVTDRGPFSKRFIIDLSHAAARELDIIHKGFSMVEIAPYEEVIVPFKAERSVKVEAELNMDFQPVEEFPLPSWMPESTKGTAQYINP